MSVTDVAGTIAFVARVGARPDAVANENSAIILGICGAPSQWRPRRSQRAHGSPGKKLQRTLEALQALQTRAGGGMMMTRCRAVGRRKCQQGTPRARVRWSSGVEMKCPEGCGCCVWVWKFVMKFDDGWLEFNGGSHVCDGPLCGTSIRFSVSIRLNDHARGVSLIYVK